MFCSNVFRKFFLENLSQMKTPYPNAWVTRAVRSSAQKNFGRVPLRPESVVIPRIRQHDSLDDPVGPFQSRDTMALLTLLYYGGRELPFVDSEEKMSAKHFCQGDDLFREGDPADCVMESCPAPSRSSAK
jgi:hypothetical protein